jgi:hypothetical protein
VENNKIMAEDALVQKDEKSPFDRLTRKTALVVLLLVLPIQFAFIHASFPGEGRAAAICAGMVMTSVWIRWDLRNHLWFWVTVTLLILLHVALVVSIPWTDHSYPGITLLPVALLDLAVAYGAIKLVELLVIFISRRK